LEECVTEDDRAFRAALSQKQKSSSAAKGPGGGGGGRGDKLKDKQKEKQRKRRERNELKNAVGPLLEAARKAFTAYIRGYSAREKAVRHIFSTRALHLGHVARSFALKEVPTALAKGNQERKGERDDDDDEGDILKSTGKKRNARLAFGGKRHRVDDAEHGDNDGAEGNGPVDNTGERSDRGSKRRNGGSKHDDSGSRSRTTSSFVNPPESLFDSVHRVDGKAKAPSFSNARAKMHANARKLQDSSMDHM